MGRLRLARSAERLLRTATGAQKNDWLLRSAAALESHPDAILDANARDLAAAEALGLSSALLDRLKLTPPRLRAMADGLRAVAALPDPVGRLLDSSRRPNGLQVAKVAVPLGVVWCALSIWLGRKQRNLAAERVERLPQPAVTT